jgi:FkbH-like protein
MKRANELREKRGESAEGLDRLAVLASFTADFMAPYISVESSKIGHPVEPWFGPFSQFEQVVLDAESEFNVSPPQIVWIAMRLEDVDPMLEIDSLSASRADVSKRLEALTARLVALAKLVRKGCDAPILISNLCLADRISPDIFAANDVDALAFLVVEANLRLASELAEFSDTHIFDYCAAVNECGMLRWDDPKLRYLARAPAAAQCLAPFSRRLARSCAALLRPAAKCIVVDLDNTLWAGVLGDDGVGGIQIGDDYPGNIYKQIQGALLALRRRGFLLAIASKNDQVLVDEVLETHPEMLLRADDFASILANWKPKFESLKQIAKELNIGVDSLVFIDDNPVERAEVRANLPMVHVVELPPQPYLYLQTIVNIPEFDRPRLLSEDRQRADMYVHQKARQAHEEQFEAVEDFLSSLEMRATYGCCDSRTIKRIHQLVQKTNQFNLTTRRHRLEEIRRLSLSEGARVCWLRLRDRFGDQGLVAVGILRRLDDTMWEVDTFLMSCRVMGRQVEHAFISFLAEQALDCGATMLRAIYLPTARNHMVADLYPRLGFVGANDSSEKLVTFTLDLAKQPLIWPEVISRSNAEKS